MLHFERVGRLTLEQGCNELDPVRVLLGHAGCIQRQWKRWEVQPSVFYLAPRLKVGFSYSLRAQKSPVLSGRALEVYPKTNYTRRPWASE